MIDESGYHVKGVKFVSRLLIGLLFVSIAEVEDAGLEKNCMHTVISSWITSFLKGEPKATLGLRLWRLTVLRNRKRVKQEGNEYLHEILQ